MVTIHDLLYNKAIIVCDDGFVGFFTVIDFL